MPILSYFAIAGTALLGLLLYANATLEPRGPLAINNEFQGLPKPWHGPAFHSLAAAPAPAPDMNSDAVRAAAAGTEVTPKATAAAAEQARAEAAPKKKRHVARRAPPPEDPYGAPRYSQHYAWRGEAGPYGGGGFFFGRF